MKNIFRYCLFIILFFCFIGIKSSLDEVQAHTNPYILGATTPDPCETAGCTGTYDTCWTGEYTGDTDKACQDSGASQSDGTVSGDIIQTNGDVYARINSSNDYISYAPISNTIDAAGTVTFELTTGATNDSACYLIVVHDDGGTPEYYALRTGNSSGNAVSLQARYHTPGDVWHTTTNRLAASTTFKVKWSWHDSNNDSYFGWAWSGGDDEDENTSISYNTLDSPVAKVAIGDYVGLGCADPMEIDDVVFKTGYDNTKPTWP